MELVSKASRSHTYGCSHNSSKRAHRRQQQTIPTSSGALSGVTHSAHNALQQHIMIPLTEKWNTDNRGARRVEHDPSAKLSYLKFADDILLISGSLKHTTTMLDDLITATSAHGLQLQPTKTKNISNNIESPTTTW